ncbi:MAG TPA: Hpt domain-containing protein, partial [Gemmatimonadaceae bacterium]|nr:Hpt domain-containing protein [Gemmatimonadaceae bacterium]
MNRERLAAQLLVTFVGELEEQVRQMNADLLALEATPTAAEPMRSVFRVAHTLKGAARAAGVPAIESACHALESMLIPVRDGQRPITAEEFAHLFRAADALADAGERLRRGEDLTGGGLARLAGEVAGVPAATAPPPPARPAATVAEPEAAAMPVAPRASSGRGAVRVEEAKLEALFAAASELSTAVASVGELGDDLRALGAAAEACSVRWRRVQRRLRLAAERASTSSELRRELDSLDEAVTTLVEDASRAARRGKQDAHALAGASAELTRHVYGLHTRPLADGLEPLPRLVRDLATAAGKSVRLETSGGEVEADRAVLDALREPVVHLVRNAVDHGIESPDVRARRGKSTRGRVSVSALVLGDRLVVQ